MAMPAAGYAYAIFINLFSKPYLGLAEAVVQVNTVWIFRRRKVVMVQEKQV